MSRKLAFALVTLAAIPLASAAGKKQTNQQIFEHFLAVTDSRQYEKYLEAETPDLEMTTPMGTTRTSEGHVQLAKNFGAAIPNFKNTATRCIESGDLISCEGKFAGEFTGSMAMPNGQSVPPNGKHVEFPWSGHASIKDARVAKFRVYFDLAGFMAQLAPVAAAKP